MKEVSTLAVQHARNQVFPQISTWLAPLLLQVRPEEVSLYFIRETF